MRPQRPEQRPVRDWKAAEQLAAAWMRYLGFPDAHVTPEGADGGIDVRARHALAQVKFKASQVGGPDLQRLFGARGTATEKQLLFFTGTAYSSKATEYANATGIALFVYDWLGDVEGANDTARRMLRAAAEPPTPPAGPEAPRQMTAGYLTGRTAPSGPPPAYTPRTRWERASDTTGGAITTGILKAGLAAWILAFFSGAFTIFGIADVVHQAPNWGASALTGTIALTAYTLTALWIRHAVASIRARSRQWATAAAWGMIISTGALFVGTAVSMQNDPERPGGAGTESFVAAGALIVLLGALLARRPRA